MSRSSFVHPLEPFLAPPGVKASWAEHSTSTELRFAHDSVEDDSRRLQRFDATGLLVNKARDLGIDAISAAAEGHELDVEVHAAMHVSGRQGCENLLVRLHANEIARLETQSRYRNRLVYWNQPRCLGARMTASR